MKKRFPQNAPISLIMLTAVLIDSGMRGAVASEQLFPADLPSHAWTEFRAAGYAHPVTGVMYRLTPGTGLNEGEDGAELTQAEGPLGGDTDQPLGVQRKVSHGMPLGAIATGYLNLDMDGQWGRYTIFNNILPTPIREMQVPFLGLSVGGEARVLTVESMEKAQIAQEIDYWGHYPVVDAHFKTDLPVVVSLRGWSPFLPGDTANSNLPGAVFEIHLQNKTQKKVHGTLALNFPGPSGVDAMGSTTYRRETLKGPLQGVFVSAEKGVLSGFSSYTLQLQYVLGLIGQGTIRTGGGLGNNGQAWSVIGKQLPAVEETHAGASLALDFSLNGQARAVYRFVLTWYAPAWHGQYGAGEAVPRQNYFHRYGTRYQNAADVAEHLATNHKSLLKRILAWQEVLYAEDKLPGWLRDSLLNVNTSLVQNSFWVCVPKKTGWENWYGADGLFGVNESINSCAQPSCIPCEWLGNLPLVYFFPDLVDLNLKGFHKYQRISGEVPFDFGLGTVLQFPWYSQGNIDSAPDMDGSFYIHMVDRMWQRTGDDDILRKYYRSAKAAMEFIKTHDSDGNGLPETRAYHGSFGTSIWACSQWLGSLKILERMALHMGDKEYAGECRNLFALAAASLERDFWDPSAGCYLMNYDATTGKKTDTISCQQLSGHWVGHYHGLPEVLPERRVKAILSTFEERNIAATPHGMVTFARPGGEAEKDRVYSGLVASWGSVLPMLSSIYMDDAHFHQLGVEVIRRTWRLWVIDNGLAFNMYAGCDPGKGSWWGEDYYHNTLLWAVPAAIYRQDIKTHCAPGGLIDRILRAAEAG